MGELFGSQLPFSEWKHVLAIAGSTSLTSVLKDVLEPRFIVQETTNPSHFCEASGDPDKFLNLISTGLESDGFVRLDWAQQVVAQAPGAYVLALSFEDVVGNPGQWGRVLESLEQLKSFLERAVSKFAPAVIVLLRSSPGTPQSSECPNDRLAMLSQHSGVPKSRIVVLNKAMEPSEYTIFVDIVESMANGYYSQCAAALLKVGTTHQASTTAPVARIRIAIAIGLLYDKAGAHSKSLYHYESAMHGLCALPMTALCAYGQVLASAELVFFRMFHIHLQSGNFELASKKFQSYIQEFRQIKGYKNTKTSLEYALYYEWLALQYAQAAKLVAPYFLDAWMQTGTLFLEAAKAWATYRDLSCEGFEQGPLDGHVVEKTEPSSLWLGKLRLKQDKEEGFLDYSTLFEQYVIEKLLRTKAKDPRMIEFLEDANVFCKLESEEAGRAPNLRVQCMIENSLGKEYVRNGKFDVAKEYLSKCAQRFIGDGWYGSASRTFTLLRECAGARKDMEERILFGLMAASYLTATDPPQETSIHEYVKKDMTLLEGGPICINLREKVDPAKAWVMSLWQSLLQVSIGWTKSPDAEPIVVILSIATQTNSDILKYPESVQINLVESGRERAVMATRYGLPHTRHFTSTEYPALKQQLYGAQILWSATLESVNPEIQFKSCLISLGPMVSLKIAEDGIHSVGMPEQVGGLSIHWGLKPLDPSIEEMCFHNVCLNVPEVVLSGEMWPIEVYLDNTFGQGNVQVRIAISLEPAENGGIVSIHPSHKDVWDFIQRDMPSSESRSVIHVSASESTARIWACCQDLITGCIIRVYARGENNEIRSLLQEKHIDVLRPLEHSIHVLQDSHTMGKPNFQVLQDKNTIVLPPLCYILFRISSMVQVSIDIVDISVDMDNDSTPVVLDGSSDSLTNILAETLTHVGDSLAVPFRISASPSSTLSGCVRILWKRRCPFKNLPHEYAFPVVTELPAIHVPDTREESIKADIVLKRADMAAIGSLLQVTVEIMNISSESDLFTIVVKESDAFLVHGGKQVTLPCPKGTQVCHSFGLIPYRTGYVLLPSIEISTTLGLLKTIESASQVLYISSRSQRYGEHVESLPSIDLQ